MPQIEIAIGLVVAHHTPWRAIRAGEQLSDSKVFCVCALCVSGSSNFFFFLKKSFIFVSLTRAQAQRLLAKRQSLLCIALFKALWDPW